PCVVCRIVTSTRRWWKGYLPCIFPTARWSSSSYSRWSDGCWRHVGRGLGSSIGFARSGGIGGGADGGGGLKFGQDVVAERPQRTDPPLTALFFQARFALFKVGVDEVELGFAQRRIKVEHRRRGDELSVGVQAKLCTS